MDVVIPKLSPARAPRKVAVPRFRRKTNVPTTLTLAVHRVLTRALGAKQPFAVFAMDGRLVITNLDTDRYKTMQRRSAESFVSTYTSGVTVNDVLEDLREHFSDDTAAQTTA